MEFENLLQSESSDDDRVNAPHRPKRGQRSAKRKRQSFISPSLVLKTFPNIAPDALCQLTELDPPTPSDVLNLIPAATSAQIAKFFDTLSQEPAKSPTPASDQVAKLPAEDPASMADELKVDLESAEDTRQRVSRKCI